MKKLTLIGICLGVTFGVNAQSISPDVVASSGTHYSNGTAQLSWTIGEPMIATYDNGSNTLTQGFHQPLLTVTGIYEAAMDLEGITVYPNPVNYLLNITLTDQHEKLITSLYDASGRIVLTDDFIAGVTQHQIDLTGIANGSYILRLVTKSGRQASFNVQKIQP